MSKIIRIFFKNPDFHTTSEYFFDFKLDKYSWTIYDYKLRNILDDNKLHHSKLNIKSSNWCHYGKGLRYFTIKNYKIV